MTTLIVYIDDAQHAQQLLAPLTASSGAPEATHWILIGCAPRVTHRVSKWVTHSARENWRERWASKAFSQLVPMLQTSGSEVTTQIAPNDRTLTDLSNALLAQHAPARVVDARRPKFGQDMQPVTAGQKPESHTLMGYATALVSAGLLVAAD